MSSSDERPRSSDVDCLDPVPGNDVKDIDVRVAVHKKLALTNGHCRRSRWVHDLAVARLSALHVYVNAKCIEHKKEFAVGKFDSAKGVNGIVRQEPEHLVVRVDQGCEVEVEKK